MAKIVLTAEYVSLNGTDISAYLTKGKLSVESDVQETTNYGSAGWQENLGGIKSAELGLSFLNDVAAAAIDSIMWPLFNTVVTFEVRASNAIVGASNPKYTGSVLISAWNPVGGGVGDVNASSVTYKATGTVTRAIA